MSVVADMLASYRGPHKVVARHLAMGPREDRALAILMAGCVLLFVSSWPYNARLAHLEGRELGPLIGGALFGLLFIAPLAFYLMASVMALVLRFLGWKGGAFAARFALFWALFASSPLLLLHGVTKGYLGAGTEAQIVGFFWLTAFLWFWISGLFQAGRGAR